jgi:serine/threonine protein kinase
MTTEIEKSEYQPGEFIAKRYEVKKALGRGGMGMVYLVVDHKVGETMALKTIRPEYTTDGAALHRFGREVRTIRKLNHPGIVRVRDAFRYGSLVFYTMDYVQGKSIRDLISERSRLGLGSTVRILALVAHALEHAHKVTIHRDLSPENVMVLQDGSIRLLDFGLAKLTEQEPTFTRINTTLGKQQYISREQLISARDVDHRTDIYALGIMFYEMLTGQLPEDNKSITDIVPTLPKTCDAFFARATATARDDRYGTAGEFRRAIIYLYREAQEKKQRKKADFVSVGQPAPQQAAPSGVAPGEPGTAKLPAGAGIWQRLKALFRWRRRR